MNKVSLINVLKFSVNIFISVINSFYDHNKLHPIQVDDGSNDEQTQANDESMWKSLANEVCVRVEPLLILSNNWKASSQYLCAWDSS